MSTQVSLGEICEVIGGVSYKPADLHPEFDDSSIPLLRANNIQNGAISYNDILFVDSSRVSQSQILQDGDILVCASSGSISSVGKAALFNCSKNVTFGAFCKAVRSRSIQPEYLSFFFQSGRYRRLIESFCTGTNINNLNSKIIQEIPLPIPDKKIQAERAKQLGAISSLVSQCKKIQGKFDELVKSRFIEMFGDLSANDKNWQTARLSELCDVRDGTHASPKYCKSGYPLMTSKNFSQGFADFSSAKLISQADFDEINKRSQVDVGDIVMPMIGTIGSPVIIRTKRKFAIKNVALFKLEDSQVNATFLKSLLESDYFSRAVESGNRGATQKFMSLGRIRNLSVPVVPEAYQITFANFVTQVDKLRFDVQQQIEKLETLKKSLMQEYFG